MISQTKYKGNFVKSIKEEIRGEVKGWRSNLKKIITKGFGLFLEPRKR